MIQLPSLYEGWQVPAIYITGSQSPSPPKHQQQLQGIREPFCQSWSKSDAANHSLQPFDEWYTHNPSWMVINETEDEFCMVHYGLEPHPLIGNLEKIHANQFYSSCNRVLSDVCGHQVGVPTFLMFRVD